MRSVAIAVVLAAVACALTASRPAAAVATSCPDSNPPNTMTLVGGTPQTAQLHSPFGQSFQVALTNTNGCPVTTQAVGVPVTFTAPAAGPSGTFAGSGSGSVTVGADASGAASAPQFTANGATGGYTVVASSSYGTVSFSLTNSASGLPATIAADEPTRSSATAGTRYAHQLVATVRDGNGNPVEDATVTFAFAVGASGASAVFDGGAAQAAEETDAAGDASSPFFTANAVAGSFLATASVAGVVEPTGFSLDNLPGAAIALSALRPVKRTVIVGSHFGAPLEVKVRGANGAIGAGTVVTFAIGGAAGAAGASFTGGGEQATAIANAHGIAVSPRLIADDVAGTYTVTATTSDAPHGAAFAFRNVPARPAKIAAGVAADESAAIGSRFPVRFAVTVTDAYGNVVPRALITFTAPSSGAGGHFSHGSRIARVHTDAAGVAVAPAFIANHTRGGFVVRARVRGSSQVAAFALVNQ